MCAFRGAVFAVISALFLQGGLFLQPCSEIFSFQEPDNISARLEFENDLSGIYKLKVKLAIAVHSNESITIRMNTSKEDIQNGKNLVFKVQLSENQSAIPTPVSVTFNEKLYCDDAAPNGPIRVRTHFYESTPFRQFRRPYATIWELWRSESANRKSSRSKRAGRESTLKPTSNTSECGLKREYFPLLLEAEPTEEGEYPWLVALFYFEKFRCAGTLVSNRHVITAAHCVSGNIDRRKLYAVFGTHNIDNWFVKSIYRNAENIIVHQDYFNVSHADIAVIIIDAPVAFSQLIRPVSLWDESIDVTNVIGEKGTIAGWGSDEAGNACVPEARQIEIPIVGGETCLRSDHRFYGLTSNRTFCAGNRDGKIPCKGDSGSGFVMERKGKWKLRGIVSSALSDAQASCDGNHYAVFTDVPQYTMWLNSILTEAYKPQPGISTDRYEPQPNNGMKVICYFTNWSFHRKGTGKFLPKDIDGDLCTHIIYCFAVLDESSLTLKTLDKMADIDNQLYNKVISYQSKGIKVSIALGGWDDSIGDKYSRLVNDAAARRRFISHITNFIEKWGFDGLDIQWKYPKCWRVDCNKGPESDKPEFAKFIKELHEAFAPRGWLLSAGVGPDDYVIDQAYDVPTLSKYLDWIAVFCYDYHGEWDKKTGHHAPLYYYPGDMYNTHNANHSINYWIELGADPKKLIMSVPEFGRSFTLADPNKNGLNAKSGGPGLAGEFTTTDGFLAFYEICTKIKNDSWNVVRDPEGRIGPYAFKDNQWVGYDDIAEFKRKSQYIKAKGLGGGLIWSISLDDFRNMCGCGNYPLLRMMNYELRGIPLEVNLQNCT